MSVNAFKIFSLLKGLAVITAELKDTKCFFIDASVQPRQKLVKMQPGTYELERIVSPLGFEESWLVFKGTFIGEKESFWREFAPVTGEVVCQNDILLFENGIPMRSPFEEG